MDCKENNNMEEDVWRNLKTIFIFIRFDIKNKKNVQVTDAVIKIIEENCTLEEMCKKILNIMPEWTEQLIIEGNEKKLICKKELKIFIIRALELMKISIELQNDKMAYDIADMLHALPDIIIANRKNCLKEYWKIYVKPVQKKWKIFKEFKYVFHGQMEG